jgi:hypothetical protein
MPNSIHMKECNIFCLLGYFAKQSKFSNCIIIDSLIIINPQVCLGWVFEGKFIDRHDEVDDEVYISLAACLLETTRITQQIKECYVYYHGLRFSAIFLFYCSVIGYKDIALDLYPQSGGAESKGIGSGHGPSQAHQDPLQLI